MDETFPVAVSGATRGIGRALALRFAELGHPVAACGKSEERVHRLAEALAGLGPGHTADVVDVRDADAVRRWAHRCSEAQGAPGLVVANAGVVHPQRPVWEVPPEDFSETLAVNVGGVYAMVRAFLPLLAGRGGTLVAVSSGWGRSARKNLAPYTASKFAVEGLVRAVKDEAPEGVNVVAVAPDGAVDTDGLATCLPEEHTDYPRPEEWAREAAEFLRTGLPAASADTGLVFPSVTRMAS